MPLTIFSVGLWCQIVSANSVSMAFPRAGCLLVIWGIFIEAKYVIRILGDNVYTGTGMLTVGEVPVPKNMKERWERILHHIGLAWVTLGTFVWGFGDLV